MISWSIGTLSKPTTSLAVVGFAVPMDHEITDRYPIGKALMYNETHFDAFRWKDVPSPTSYKLKIEVAR